MLHKNHYYRYFGNIRDQDELIEFALGLFHEGEHKEKVPKLPTLLDEIFDVFNKEVVHRGGFLKTFFMLDSQGNPSYMAIFCVYILPILIVWGFYKLMQLPFQTEEDTVERTKILDAKNAATKAQIDRWIQKHPALRRRNRKWE